MRRALLGITLLASLLTMVGGPHAQTGRFVVAAEGETLYRIARGAGVDPLALAEANGIAAPYIVRPGDRLRLPEAPVSRIVASTRLPGASVDGEPLVVEMHRGAVLRLPRRAATLFVADPEIADVQVKSPTLVHVFGKKVGDTTLIAADGTDGILLERTIRVVHGVEGLRAAIAGVAPGQALDISSVSGALMVSGTVRTPQAADTVRRLALAAAGDEKALVFNVGVNAPTQVNLRVRIAEMSREMSRQIGFSLNGSASGDIRFGLQTSPPFALPSLSSLALGGNLGPVSLDTLLDALDRNRQIRVLAEPNLTALSGETANFLAGGEFPIIVPQSENQATVEFKKFGVSLSFTPTVLSEGRINLHVRPEVSQLSTNGAVSFQGFTIPSLTTRRAETTVELASGESFAVAGLLRGETADNLSRFPGLGDIPVLGALFRSKDFQSNETELVIVVTPFLVRPTDRVAVPTDVVLPGQPLVPGFETPPAGRAPDPIVVPPTVVPPAAVPGTPTETGRKAPAAAEPPPIAPVPIAQVPIAQAPIAPAPRPAAAAAPVPQPAPAGRDEPLIPSGAWRFPTADDDRARFPCRRRSARSRRRSR